MPIIIIAMATLWISLIAISWFVVDRLLHSAFSQLGDRQILPFRLGRGLERTLRFLLFTVAILLAVQTAGVPLNRVWTALSTLAALLAVGFVAFWSVASNVLCAFIIHLVRPFRVGDDIELFEPNDASPGVRGTVTDIGAFYTVLSEHANPGYRLLIPNNSMLQRGVRIFTKTTES